MDSLLSGITIEDIRRLRMGSFRFPVYVNSAAMQNDILDLDMCQRGANCLKRAGMRTVGDLVRQIDSEEDLLKLRNLGKISAKDIMFSLFTYQFSVLPPEKRKAYLEKTLAYNGLKKCEKA